MQEEVEQKTMALSVRTARLTAERSITHDNIKDFEGTARKYGIDFALKEDISENPPRYQDAVDNRAEQI